MMIMSKAARTPVSGRMLKAAALALVLLLGQWVALAHACTIDVSQAGDNFSVSAPEHQAPEHGELFCMATAVSGDELADAVLTPLAGDFSGADFASPAWAPLLVSNQRVATSHLPNRLGSRALLALFGRLRI